MIIPSYAETRNKIRKERTSFKCSFLVKPHFKPILPSKLILNIVQPVYIIVYLYRCSISMNQMIKLRIWVELPTVIMSLYILTIKGFVMQILPTKIHNYPYWILGKKIDYISYKIRLFFNCIAKPLIAINNARVGKLFFYRLPEFFDRGYFILTITPYMPRLMQQQITFHIGEGLLLQFFFINR